MTQSSPTALSACGFLDSSRDFRGWKVKDSSPDPMISGRQQSKRLSKATRASPELIAQSACVIFSPTNQFGKCNTYVEIGATWGWNMSQSENSLPKRRKEKGNSEKKRDNQEIDSVRITSKAKSPRG
jgi:hypothetical protein